MEMHKPKHLSKLLLLLFISLGANADSDIRWSELHFEAKSMWATALTSLSLSKRDSSKFGEVWELLLEGSVASNTEREIILMTPGSGALLQRDRFTSGKNKRLKQYAYTEGKVSRTRREPQADSAEDSLPEGWPISSTRVLDRPSEKECPVITSIPSLLVFAEDVAKADGQTITTCVQSDNNFYQVSMTVGGEKKISVNYTLAGLDKKVKGKRSALQVNVTSKIAGKANDDPDFSLLGLSEPLIIWVDKESGIPLRVKGKAPRVGNAEINLIAAREAPID